MESSHESVEVGGSEAAENVDGSPVQVESVVLLDADQVKDTLLTEVLSHTTTVCVTFWSFYNNFITHSERVLNNKLVQLTWYDSISLLSLSMDQRPRNLNILLLLLDPFILRVVKRDIQIVIFLTGPLIIIFLEHERGLGFILGVLFLAQDAFGDAAVRVDHLVLAVKLL